jgi:hypothetical protein
VLVRLFLAVTKYLRKQLKEGRVCFSSQFQKFLSIMVGEGVEEKAFHIMVAKKLREREREREGI